MVFVHGLAHHESSWGRSYLDAAREADTTPLTVRYTTGQSIADSGAELAELLDRLVVGWPVPVTRIVLVGHSMGGLVIRAGLAVGGSWHALVSDVITLGTPHAGSPVERFAARGLAAASTFAVAAPIVALGDERSLGIKELGFPSVAAPSDRTELAPGGSDAAPPRSGGDSRARAARASSGPWATAWSA